MNRGVTGLESTQIYFLIKKGHVLANAWVARHASRQNSASECIDCILRHGKSMYPQQQARRQWLFSSDFSGFSLPSNCKIVEGLSQLCSHLGTTTLRIKNIEIQTFHTPLHNHEERTRLRREKQGIRAFWEPFQHPSSFSIRSSKKGCTFSFQKLVLSTGDALRNTNYHFKVIKGHKSNNSISRSHWVMITQASDNRMWYTNRDSKGLKAAW